MEDLFQHNPDQKYGENIYSSWSSCGKIRARAKDAVQSWYQEIKYHDFEAESSTQTGSGHFTQVVWADSKRLGVGLARKEGRLLVVANYGPPGNFRGEYRSNVPRPI